MTQDFERLLTRPGGVYRPNVAVTSSCCRNSTARCSVIIATALAVCSCATVKVLETPAVTERVGMLPTLGTATTAPVGSILFSQFRYWARTGYRLSEPFVSEPTGMRVYVGTDLFLLPSEAAGAPAYCTERLTVRNFIGQFVSATCFFDPGRTGAFTQAKFSVDVAWRSADVHTPLRYVQAEEIIPRSDAVKRELLYQGRTGESLKLAYREYINDMARPAYFQDVAYDVATLPATITFRTVRIEVTVANNNGLTYRVLSGF